MRCRLVLLCTSLIAIARRSGLSYQFRRACSDDGLHHFASSPQAGYDSDFSEEDSESDNELERHLPLLLPEELADLGADALRIGNHEAALRYLLLAQLRWCEGLAKRLALRESVQVLACSQVPWTCQ